MNEKTDPICNYQVIENPDAKEFIVDFLIGESINDKLPTDILSKLSFSHLVQHMKDDIFDQIFIDEKYGTHLRNIEGVIEHSYYHLGQVSVIKKLIMADAR